MDEFKDAVAAWNKRKEAHIASVLDAPKSKIAPRTELFVTVPINRVAELKAIIKAMRQEEDENLKSDMAARNSFLALEFEKSNPIPKIQDFMA